MAWTVYQFFLSGLMLITGSINTLSTKWADTSNSTGCGKFGKEYTASRPFDHPFLQSVGMFLGEFSCLLFFKACFYICKYKRTRGKDVSPGLNRLVEGNQEFSPLIFWPAALCDMCGTTLMYIGLNMTDASSFQMLRGAVIVFTALLSVTFLQRQITRHMWLGILFVILGLVVVGLADVVYKPPGGGSAGSPTDSNTIITGDLLIVMGQIVTASQMVYEEKFLYKYNVAPLQAVGWEGFFGFVTLGTLLFPMYFIIVGPDGSFITKDPDYRLENAIDAFCQIGHNYQILIAQVGNILSIAFFNFSGISVTRELSATTRMVLDSLRTLVVWVVSVGVWGGFNPVQIPGFILLGVGTAVYNGLLSNSARKFSSEVNRLYRRVFKRGAATDDETEPLIN